MADSASQTVGGLFRQRELQALRLLAVVRIIWLLVGWVIALFAAHNDWERQVMTIAMTFVLLPYILFIMWRLSRGQVQFAGIGSVAFDLLVIAGLPLMWREAVGGADAGVPVYFAFKTSMFGFMMALIAMTGLALRPLYVLVETVGMLVICLVYFAWSVLDDTGYVGGDYYSHAMEGDMFPTLWFSYMGLVAGTGCLVAGIAWSARKITYEVSHVERIATEMGRYLSPNIARLLEKDPDGMHLGGQRRVLSFVFTDLAGFTRFVDQTDPAIAVQVINDYLDGMTRIALDHGGTVDKVVGDALHVFFNAPEEQPDHARKAIDCGLAMDVFAEEFAADQQQQNRDFGKTRIGIHTGDVTVGNFGGSILFDYTAHGQAINIAARLEEANKEYKTRMLASKAVVDASGWQGGISLGMMEARGTGQVLEVFTPSEQGRFA